MIDPLIRIDYPNLPDSEVIKEIVRLAESNDKHAGREAARIVTNFFWDCNKQKRPEPIDQTLLAITEITANHSRMSSILRSALCFKDSLEHWYSSRDKILEILTREEPDRVKRLMIGLHDEDPKVRVEMDGLDAWQSIIKTAAEYA
jgi:predicted secreted protein